MRGGWRVCGVVVLALGLGACEETGPGEQVVPSPARVRIGPENVVTVSPGRVVVGPMISGELRAQRQATVRAEAGGAMTEVAVDLGQVVSQGSLLGRIEMRTLDEARLSAGSAVRAAENQVAVTRREVERNEQLVSAGAIAARDLDLARNTAATAEAQLADARARLASAERQLGDTVIRAPIGGVVARRAVNVGDVVSAGTELFTIIDPSSMRLEASVPSDDLSQLRVGAAVDFNVRGYEQAFTGRIERMAPRADPTTRQIAIYVAIPNVGGRLVSGLFAEGRVVSASASGLVVPSDAVNTSGETPWVLRVTAGKAERVTVSLGLRDPRSERAEVSGGLTEGDVLLRGAAQAITPGTPVTVSR